MAQYFDDRNIVPEFKTITTPNEAKSKEAGRPIFDEMEVCELRFGGDMQNRPVFPAHDGTYLTREDGSTEFVTYAERFPKQYERFKAGKAQAKDGTPLEEAPFLSSKQRSELKGLQIYTVEQLASLDDRRLKTLGMDGRTLQQAASAYIFNATSSAEAVRLAAENAELRERLAKAEAAQTKAAKVEEKEEPVSHGFQDWSVDDLKAYIEEATGSKPRGNPNKDTLVRMAEEATEQ